MKMEINSIHNNDVYMYQPAGYARLKTSLAISGALICSVLLYQYLAYRPASSTRPSVNSEGLSSYRTVQLFPQTMPNLSRGAYQLLVTDLSGNQHALGTFLVPNQDQVTNTDGTIRTNAVFTLPATVTGLADAEIRLVNRDTTSAPFSIAFLKGDFKQDRAFVEFNGVDAAAASGQYILGTPTDGNETLNERSGVWFGYYKQGTPLLRLPALKAGWTYEGWAIVDGQPLTTGRFQNASARDLFNGFSDVQTTTPEVPGEDFLRDPPVAVFPNLSFPLDLAGDLVAVSIEPDFDGSDPTGQGPFGMTILKAEVPNRAEPHAIYDLKNTAAASPKATIVLRP